MKKRSERVGIAKSDWKSKNNLNEWMRTSLSPKLARLPVFFVYQWGLFFEGLSRLLEHLKPIAVADADLFFSVESKILVLGEVYQI
nr:hypothetical protein CFP56_72293 [Quercus suber]